MICCCSFSFSIRRGVTRSSEPVTTDFSLTAFSPSSLVYIVILLSSTACILFSVTTEGRDRIFALEFCCSALSRTRKLGVSLNIVLNMPMPSFCGGGPIDAQLAQIGCIYINNRDRYFNLNWPLIQLLNQLCIQRHIHLPVAHDHRVLS